MRPALPRSQPDTTVQRKTLKDLQKSWRTIQAPTPTKKYYKKSPLVNAGKTEAALALSLLGRK